MSEDIYTKPDFTKKVRFQAAVKEDRNTDACKDVDDARIYDNYWAEESPPQDESQDKSPDNTTEDQQKSVEDVKTSSCRAAAVCLGLLCLLLLIGLINLVCLFTKGNSEMVLLHHSYTNLTKERDQLQTSYTNLTKERDQLQSSYNNLTKERDQLQTSYNNQSKERDQLQKRVEDMAKERNDLQRELQDIKQGWVYFSGSVYYISSLKKTWQESSDDCVQRGADLVIINSIGEQEFIRRFQKQLWIGLTDRETEGGWKWVDGTLLTISFWASSEPNGNPWRDEDCAEITDHNSRNNWNDDQCHRLKFWVCEKKSSL